MKLSCIRSSVSPKKIWYGRGFSRQRELHKMMPLVVLWEIKHTLFLEFDLCLISLCYIDFD